MLQQVPLHTLWLQYIYPPLLLRSAAGGRPQLEFSSILGEDGLPVVRHLCRPVMLVGLGGTHGWFGGVRVWSQYV